MAEVDFEMCMRYVRGEASLAEAKAVRAWLKEPANKLLAQHWMSRHAATLEGSPETAVPPAFNYARVQASLYRRTGLDAVDTKPRPVATAWRRWAAAAAVVLTAGVGGALYVQQHSQVARQAVVAPRQFTTGNGQTRVVHLPDGSTVTLNANSTLRYAATWDAQTPREVWLDGEAFFSVQHLANHQRFRVHTTGNFNVEVLGTKFTVYRRHSQERVVLLSGKVRVDFKDQSQPDVLLKPGELLQTADAKPQRIVHKAVAAPAYAAFTANKLVLDDTPIPELAERLRDTYGIDVVVLDSALNKQTITGTVPVGDLDLLCQAMQASFGIKVERQPQRILLSSL